MLDQRVNFLFSKQTFNVFISWDIKDLRATKSPREDNKKKEDNKKQEVAEDDSKKTKGKEESSNISWKRNNFYGLTKIEVSKGKAEPESEKTRKARSPEPQQGKSGETEKLKSPKASKGKVLEEPEIKDKSRGKLKTKEDETQAKNAHLKSPSPDKSPSKNDNLAEKLGLKEPTEKAEKAGDKNKGKKASESSE